MPSVETAVAGISRGLWHCNALFISLPSALLRNLPTQGTMTSAFHPGGAKEPTPQMTDQLLHLDDSRPPPARLSQAAPLPQRSPTLSPRAIDAAATSIRGALETCHRTGQSCSFSYETDLPLLSRYRVHATILDDDQILVIARPTPEHGAAGDAPYATATSADTPRLTVRQLAVLRLVAAGKTDKEIASRLRISSYTASKHIGNILRRLHAASRTEATLRAVQEGIIAIPPLHHTDASPW